MKTKLPTTLLILTVSTIIISETASLSLTQCQTRKDRPLLRKFGENISERVINSKEGYNRFGLEDHYTSAETIPCLDMQSMDSSNAALGDDASSSDMSSRRDIREAYAANNSRHNIEEGQSILGDERGGLREGGIHGRSSGSGCCIIRLQGKDAESVRGLVDFADDFFEGVDDDNRNVDIPGVFRIANNLHAGFDSSVNDEGKMQVLYTKFIPSDIDEEDPLLLPFEVGELVGQTSMRGAHSGMSTLFDIGSQITSAVLGINSDSTNKLLDNCSLPITSKHNQQLDMISDNADEISHNISNSYQRIIRYLKPSTEPNDLDDVAFWSHVDSTFLTLIPMPDIAGLEVWCPSLQHADSENLDERGEWVRPLKPDNHEMATRTNINAKHDDDHDDCIHVCALAGEFLQLLSNGQVPTCIHRVIAPKPKPSVFGFSDQKYKPRVSAPLFLRPWRGESAVLNVESDLRSSEYNDNSKGLYCEEGLLEECDSMQVWEYMNCMSPDN